MTGLAWGGKDTLISTGAGDAVLIWHLTPAALTACAPPEAAETTLQGLSAAQAAPTAATAATEAADMTEAFNSFHRDEYGAMRQSLEANTGLMQGHTQAQAVSAAEAQAAVATNEPVQGLHVDTVVPKSLKLGPDDADVTETLGVSQHQLLAKIGNGLQQQQHRDVQRLSAEAELHLQRVVGFNGGQCGCCVWLPETGLLVYASDQFLILEQLATREQR